MSANRAVSRVRFRGLLTTQRVSEFQFTEDPPGQHGLCPADIGELDLGTAGVLARFRPLGLAVAQQ